MKYCKGTLIQCYAKRENQKETKAQSFITQSERFQTAVLDESTDIKELVIDKSKLVIWQRVVFNTIGSKSLIRNLPWIDIFSLYVSISQENSFFYKLSLILVHTLV